MTTEQMQAIADRVLRRVALKYGSTTRRDFFVIERVLNEVIGACPACGKTDCVVFTQAGSGTQASEAKRAPSTRRSAAP